RARLLARVCEVEKDADDPDQLQSKLFSLVPLAETFQCFQPAGKTLETRSRVVFRARQDRHSSGHRGKNRVSDEFDHLQPSRRRECADRDRPGIFELIAEGRSKRRGGSASLLPLNLHAGRWFVTALAHLW